MTSTVVFVASSVRELDLGRGGDIRGVGRRCRVIVAAASASAARRCRCQARLVAALQPALRASAAGERADRERQAARPARLAGGPTARRA